MTQALLRWNMVPKEATVYYHWPYQISPIRRSRRSASSINPKDYSRVIRRAPGAVPRVNDFYLMPVSGERRLPGSIVQSSLLQMDTTSDLSPSSA
jgi:hypothetical protein